MAAWSESSLTLCISGLAFFLLAWASFNRFATDTPASKPREKTTKAHGVVHTRAGRPWEDAVAWKDFHFIHGGVFAMYVKMLAYIIVAVWIIADMSDNRWMNGEATIWIIFFLSLFAALIETAFAASRIFRIEVRGQTLGNLYILPQSLPALIRSKRRAVLYALGPIGTILGLSLICGIPTLLKGITHSVETFLVFAQIAVIIPLEFIFYYRLSAWFSLRLKWGGLPAALVVGYIGQSIMLGIVGIIFQYAFGLPIIAMLVGLNFALGKAIERMLIERAAAN